VMFPCCGSLAHVAMQAETCRPDTHVWHDKLAAYLKTYVYDRSEGQIR
jgi:hypothetical protein